MLKNAQHSLGLHLIQQQQFRAISILSYFYHQTKRVHHGLHVTSVPSSESKIRNFTQISNISNKD